MAGDRLGRIDLYEVRKKMALRTYEHEHKNQINFLDFAPSKRAFLSCSNETSWKFFDIQKGTGCIFTCQGAHSDNIKQVQFLPNSEQFVLSASSDKELKLWQIDTEMAKDFNLPSTFESDE